MTQRIRTAAARHRGRVWFATIGVALAAVLLVVLPAVAAPGDPIPPPSSTHGVTPTEIAVGGTNFDCQAGYVTDDNDGASAPHTFKINNPTNGVFTTSASGSPVTFTISNIPSSGNDKDKLFDFTVTGAGVLDVGVNGGANTAHYAYADYVGSDKGLHATRQSPNKLYSLSHLTFCYSTLGTIEGTVWRDSNENAQLDGTEAGQSGWGVFLYRDGALVDDTTTDADGDYLFENVPLGADYVVCEEAPSGSWAQTTPTTEPATCAAEGHEAGGHAFTFTQSVDDKDFGNVNTIQVDCSGGSGSLEFTTETADTSYTVKIAGGSLCGKDAEFVFEAYAVNAAERVANLHPLDEAAGTIHVIERMTWPFAGVNQPDPANRSLKYDDDASNGINPVPMPYCEHDPRSGAFDLDPSLLDGVLPGTDTSCLIESTETAGGDRVDIAYTSVDGYRGLP